ncbi:MAG: CDP-archaeol synthase [Candidatus Woesearchaeota archaeon]
MEFSLLMFIQVFFFFLPAAFANMAPVFFRKLKFLDYPLDANKTIGGKPILGKNKTVRGLVFGIVFGVIIAILLGMIAFSGFGADKAWLAHYHALQENNSGKETLPVLLTFGAFGLLLGFGALFGDALKSFVKRRIGKEPGQRWIVFDQLDWVIGAYAFASIMTGFNLLFLAIACIEFFILHILIKHLGYLLGIETKRW